MTNIRATCPVCGEIELKPAQVRLVVCTRSDLSFYAFTCTKCAQEVRKPADDEVVALLVSGGVVAETWRIPAEALEQHAGPQITYDDVLDFVLAVGRVDRLAGVLAPAPQSS